MEHNQDPKAVVEAFDLDYNIGTAVVELLSTARGAANTHASAMDAALCHVVRAMRQRGLLPPDENAAHDHANAERAYLRELAEDLVHEVRQGTEVDLVKTVEGALRGLVVRTHQRSRAELTGGS